MDIWEVLAGSVSQQRVWSFGKTPDHVTGYTRRSCGGSREADIGGEVTSSEPLSVKDGVVFTCCAAGKSWQHHQHYTSMPVAYEVMTKHRQFMWLYDRTHDQCSMHMLVLSSNCLSFSLTAWLT